MAAALEGAELVVVATEWKDYREADPAVLGAMVRNRLVIDGRNALEVAKWRDANWQVIALGRNLERLPALV